MHLMNYFDSQEIHFMNNNLPNIEDLKDNYDKILERVNKISAKCGRNPDEISIIAVSKMHPPELIERAIKAGIRIFGENYAQELRDKHEIVEEKDHYKPIWHFIGHLQTNKIKYIAPFVNMIHSVDSEKAATEISHYAEKYERTIDILLQVNTSGEFSKSGCEPDDVVEFAESVISIPHINVKGLMTIGSFSDDEKLVRKEFEMLRNIKEKLNEQFDNKFQHLSMGMSGDYEWAIQEGSTMIRIGTAIFGYRNYK